MSITQLLLRGDSIQAIAYFFQALAVIHFKVVHFADLVATLLNKDKSGRIALDVVVSRSLSLNPAGQQLSKGLGFCRVRN